MIRLSHKALLFEVCISESILSLTAFGSVRVYDRVTDPWPEFDFATQVLHTFRFWAEKASAFLEVFATLSAIDWLTI